MYLKSTFVEVNDSLFAKKEGIFMGSSVAPFLSEINLSALDVAATNWFSRAL